MGAHFASLCGFDLLARWLELPGVDLVEYLLCLRLDVLSCASPSPISLSNLVIYLCYAIVATAGILAITYAVGREADRVVPAPNIALVVFFATLIMVMQGATRL